MRNYLLLIGLFVSGLLVIGYIKIAPDLTPNQSEEAVDSSFTREIEMDGQVAIYEFHLLDEVVDPAFLAQIKEAPLLEGYEDIHVLEMGEFPWLFLKREDQIYSGLFMFFKELQLSKPLSRVDELESVAFEVNKHQFPLSTDIILARVVNHSNEEISMGMDFTIEYFDGESWLELPMSPGWGFTLPLFILAPGQSQDFEIWLDAFVTDVFSYIPGLYRIRKPIYKEDNLHDLVFEFHLK